MSPRFPNTGATKSPFTLWSDGRSVLNLGYGAEVPAWREWVSNVLSTPDRCGDTRQFLECRAAEWTPHGRSIIGLTEQVVRGAAS